MAFALSPSTTKILLTPANETMAPGGTAITPASVRVSISAFANVPGFRLAFVSPFGTAIST